MYYEKLQSEKELNDEISDNESDLPVSGGARKKLNINRYDLLNQQSHSESEVKEDDNETEANKSCEGDNNHESVKRKKKKKKKRKMLILKEVVRIMQNKRKNRGGGRGHVKMTWLVSGKDNWPQEYNTSYEHSTSYRQVQNRFLEAVESLNPDNILAIINEHPYHVDALIQLSDLCRLSEDLAMAAEFIERALYCLECAFHPLFNIAQGNCRLDYRRQENRSLYITLFKHLLFVGGRACYRTALEFCKLLLSLDPDGDPLAIKLAIDFYAIRAKEFTWLIDFYEEWESSKNLSQLPNFAFSIAVAYFHISSDDTTKADMLLQEALLMFPGVLKPLLEKCSVQTDSRVSTHAYFESKQSPALSQLILLYINRSYHIWKESELLPWLERNVNIIMDKVDKADPAIKDYESKRTKRYQGPMPRSICRHIILSDIKEYLLCQKEEDGARALPDGDANDGGDLRRSVASLVGAMRDLLSNIRIPDVPNDADVDENDESDEEDEHNNYLT
ncbi:nulp1-related [Holotrichia oblita]|uniref:Nulp1-related n=1 Tax=Holotrichia oblita TaxID=644536 RepID=A0ACB9TUA5_HOLOL|nr:nulp1-related [Holotrichia oblita]